MKWAARLADANKSREAAMDVAIDAVVQAIAGTLGGAVVAGVVKEHSTRFFLNLGCWWNRRRNRRVSFAQPDPCSGQRWWRTEYRCISCADDLAMRALAGFIAGGLLVLIFSLLNSFTRERINNK
jgi:hypothetical protein